MLLTFLYYLLWTQLSFVNCQSSHNNCSYSLVDKWLIVCKFLCNQKRLKFISAMHRSVPPPPPSLFFFRGWDLEGLVPTFSLYLSTPSGLTQTGIESVSLPKWQEVTPPEQALGVQPCIDFIFMTTTMHKTNLSTIFHCSQSAPKFFY